MKIVLFLIALFAASAAQAAAGFQCNQHGAVVTLADGTVYYLGNKCDAAQKGGGTGKWWLAASFFAIEIDGQAIRLPFEIDCDLPFCSP